MSAAITHKMTKVAAGRTAVVDVSGSLFMCRESSAQFNMSFNDGELFPCEHGFQLRPPGGFTRLVFQNLSATDELTVEFYAGDVFVGFEYQGRVPKTELSTPSPITALPDPTLIDPTRQYPFPGVNALGQRRKLFHLFNTHATQSVIIYNLKQFRPIAEGAPKTPYTLETDANLMVFNPGPANTLLWITELFYV